MKKTDRGIRRCFKWIQYCLSIGWSLESVEGLEKAFWKFKDGDGNLKKT